MIKVEPLLNEHKKLIDIKISSNNKEYLLLGNGGKERELKVLSNINDILSKLGSSNKQLVLPVLIGSGMGYALEFLINSLKSSFGNNFNLVIVDNELDILNITKLKQKFIKYPNIRWLSGNIFDVSKELTILQKDLNGIPFYHFSLPFYQRYNKEYYGEIQTICLASSKINFWESIKYPKFKEQSPKILMLTSKYFILGEMIAACKRLKVDYMLLEIPEEMGTTEFIEKLLKSVLEFKPDFILTINHLGVDQEGILTGLLENLQIPLASWFVDNPHLIIHMFKNLVSPLISIFTWDKDNIPSLKQLGFNHVFYMPLAADELRFTPNVKLSSKLKSLKSDISFVGNSMVLKVEKVYNKIDSTNKAIDEYPKISKEFMTSNERSAQDFLLNYSKEVANAYKELPSNKDKLYFETLITYESTLQYRLSCVLAIMKYNPLIIGDDSWKFLLKNETTWRFHNELNYYSELPMVYANTKVNFNCTSRQMKGAVNQRVFDVPAAGGFLLTDAQEQIYELFEPKKEVICYSSPEEASELANFYLNNDSERLKIASAARERLLSEHTYVKRLTFLLDTMKKTYS